MSINIQEITLMEQIIRVCQARGAFTPTEMKDVGILYEKLLKIITSATPAKAVTPLPMIPENSES